MVVFCIIALFFTAPVLLLQGGNTALENLILLCFIFGGLVLCIKLRSCFKEPNKNNTIKQIQKNTKELNKYTEEFGLIEWDEK